MREPNGIYPDEREGRIPRSFMHRAFRLRPVVGDESMSAMRKGCCSCGG
jgi:hypothetical protein